MSSKDQEEDTHESLVSVADCGMGKKTREAIGLGLLVLVCVHLIIIYFFLGWIPFDSGQHITQSTIIDGPSGFDLN